MEIIKEYEFYSDLEPLLSTVAHLLAADGFAREVAILATSNATVRQSGYESYDYGTLYIYTLYLQVPHWLYAQISDIVYECEKRILEKAELVLIPFSEDHDIGRVRISPLLTTDNKWREKALAWVSGDKVNNQGRVRSDNLPSRSLDGLLFRSQPEINLYNALKTNGVSFAPLPVFIRGGSSYRRIEPDFVIIKDGVVMVVEVDGDTVHTETPADAHARTTMLAHEGVYIERVKAKECETQESAVACAKQILQIMQKIRNAK